LAGDWSQILLGSLQHSPKPPNFHYGKGKKMTGKRSNRTVGNRKAAEKGERNLKGLDPHDVWNRLMSM